MEHDAKVAPYSTGDKTSFGYPTARERWPIIITGAIDDMFRSVSDCDDGPQKDEGKQIVEKLARLKYELQHNHPLVPIVDDQKPDVEVYNRELAAMGETRWMDTKWLFAECYLFRRISTFFSLSTYWTTYDIFFRQKLSTFRSSRPAILELATRYRELVEQIRRDGGATDAVAEELLFTEMCEICLWGNATDLSLLTSLSYEDIQKLQGSKARKESEKNILTNDLTHAFAALKEAKRKGRPERRVDIVLDNAGFELYVDLILAGYLLTSGLATSIVLHPKSIPWFVSDVLPADFSALLMALMDPTEFFEVQSDDEKLTETMPPKLSAKEKEDLEFLMGEWTTFYGGQLVVRPNAFWTHPGSFWRMGADAPELLDDLKQSELVVFKGDLNYRKLTCDAQWDPTTPFVEAIGPLGPGSGVNVLALRTCKADVVVGLKDGEDERLRAMEGGGGDTGARKWAWSGKWAVVSFSKGK